MSLFRKPKKRMQMRVFADEDDDEINGDSGMMDVAPSAPPAPIIHPKKSSSKSKGLPKQALLSFGDEVEEDSDFFQVKKSIQSKRLQRQKQKDKREKLQPPPPPPLDSPPPAPNLSSTNNSRKNDSYNKKIDVDGMVLAGRAALTAGKDDLSSSEEDEGEMDGRFGHSFRHAGRSVRALLDSGAIPDAALIHAARKKRQQARDIGDVIPLQQTSVNEAPTVSAKPAAREGRLVREDGAGDASDSEPERMEVKGVTARQRITLNASSGPDSEGDEWEAQQIRKAVTHSQIMAAQQETFYNTQYVIPIAHQVAEPELNPFALTTSAPILASITGGHLRPLAGPAQKALTAVELAVSLRERLEALREAREKKTVEVNTMNKELEQLKSTQEECTRRAPTAAARYEFYQRLRGYLTDLIECLDEKMPALCALEARAMTLHRRKAAFLIERRRADVRDQAYVTLQPNPSVSVKKDGRDEERLRRCAEREGRRLRRRREREARLPGASHRDGDSSDDEVPQTELVAYQTTEQQLLSDANLLFSDTLEEFSSLANVLARLEDWKCKDLGAYTDAYVGLCLPRLAGPYLRLKLLLWNPITDEDAPDWEKMQWYRGLMLYGLGDEPETELDLAEDPDIRLVPNIVMKIILPKLTELVEGTWDPASGSQCRRLGALLRRAGSLPGASSSCAPLQELAAALMRRVHLSLQHDVFIPILPESVVEMAGKGSGAFLKRQAAGGVRLLGNLAVLHGVVADSALSPLVLGSLLQRYLLPAVRICPAAYGSELCWSIASCLPRVWLVASAMQPPLQQFSVACLRVQSQLFSDNPLHLKPLDQIRATIIILQASGIQPAP